MSKKSRGSRSRTLRLQARQEAQAERVEQALQSNTGWTFIVVVKPAAFDFYSYSSAPLGVPDAAQAKGMFAEALAAHEQRTRLKW